MIWRKNHLVDNATVPLQDMLSSTDPAATTLLWHFPGIHIEVVRPAHDQGVVLSSKAAALHGAGIVVSRVVELSKGDGALDLVEHRRQSSSQTKEPVTSAVPGDMH